MSRKSCLLIVLIFFFINQTFSQTQTSKTYIVKGTVLDSTSNESVPYCTISASEPNSPSVFLKRVAAGADGRFAMNLSVGDTLLLQFESVGMRKLEKQVVLTQHITDLGNVLMAVSSSLLSEVMVSAVKPLVKVDVDRISYDLQSDPDAQTSNMLDIMQKVPLLTVDGDENIKLKGSSNFKILLNGKETKMISSNPAQVLKSIPANTIKKIEVITDPGPKYEAEGLGGIINIVTDKAMAGYSASINAGVDIFGSLNGGVYFTTKIGKWGFTTNLNTSQNKSPVGSSDYSRLNKTDGSKLTQYSEVKNTALFESGSLSISFEMDTFDLFSISGSGWGGSNHSIGTTLSNSYDSLMNLQQGYFQHNTTGNQWGGYNIEFDYQRSFMKPEELLTFSYRLSYSPDNDSNETWLDTTRSFNYASLPKFIGSQSHTSEHTFQIDYVNPIRKKHVVGAGVKYIIRNNISKNRYHTYNDGTQRWEQTDGLVDDEFAYNQGILGSYASYSYKTKKFSVRGGARFEHTNSAITYKMETDKNFVPPSFNNLVPSLSFNYKFSDVSNINLSYSQRLSRPGIWYLNPFIDNRNPYYIQKGNPDLDAEIGNSFNLSYGYFSRKINLNTSAYCSFVNNSIEGITSLHGDTIISTYKNIGTDKSVGFSSYVRWQISPKINSTINFNYGYRYLSDGDGNQNHGFNFYGSYFGMYSMPKDWSLNWYAGYYKGGVSLQGGNGAFTYYGLTLKKSFLKKKLTLSLRATSFLQRYIKFASYYETDTYRSDNLSRRVAPNVHFNISYRFGEMKEQIKKVERSIHNDDVKSSGDKNAVPQ